MKRTLYTGVLLVLLQSCYKSETKNTAIEGKIERDQIAVTTKISGRIQKILVEEGQLVQKGDTLAILEFPEVEAKSLQAKGALEAAQAQYEMTLKGATDGQLTQLGAKVDGLKEQYGFAKKSLDRMQNLLQDSLVPQQQYDEVFAKYQGAKNQLLAAQAELAEVRQGARIEQQKMAMGQKERAMGALSEVGVASNERFVIAPQNMSVETINLKTGELALAGYSLVSGYVTDGVYFRLTVPESQMTAFQVGTVKTLLIPYLNNKEINATVKTAKALSAYANISTAYPDFEQQETLFEIRLQPLHAEGGLLTKATFYIKD